MRIRHEVDAPALVEETKRRFLDNRWFPIVVGVVATVAVQRVCNRPSTIVINNYTGPIDDGRNP